MRTLEFKGTVGDPEQFRSKVVLGSSIEPAISRLSVALLLLLGACASTAKPEAIASADQSAPPTPSTPQAPPQLSAEEPSVDQGPPRAGASGSTLKTVSCGKKRCKVDREVCTNSGSRDAELWACLPKNAAALGDSVYACDDPSDCNAPLTCCSRWVSTEHFECGKPDVNCKALPCSVAEGTHCPKGQHCKDGLCGVEARATCGGGKPCPADKPYCVWSGSPECISEAGVRLAYDSLGGGRVSGVYQCTKPSDCGTQACCTGTESGPSSTSCINSCDSGGMGTVCDNIADCRQYAAERCGKNSACKKSLRCTSDGVSTSAGSVAPWLRLCSVDE